MSENLKLYIACFIFNILTLICFLILAIVFKHWWIIFFYALLHTSVKDKEDK